MICECKFKSKESLTIGKSMRKKLRVIESQEDLEAGAGGEVEEENSIQRRRLTEVKTTKQKKKGNVVWWHPKEEDERMKDLRTHCVTDNG